MWSTDFSKIFRERRGEDPLLIHKFVGTVHLRILVTEYFSKFLWGTLNLRGDPEPTKVQGESRDGVEFYKMLKRSHLYLARNSRYKGSKFDLLGPLAAKP